MLSREIIRSEQYTVQQDRFALVHDNITTANHHQDTVYMLVQKLENTTKDDSQWFITAFDTQTSVIQTLADFAEIIEQDILRYTDSTITTEEYIRDWRATMDNAMSVDAFATNSTFQFNRLKLTNLSDPDHDDMVGWENITTVTSTWERQDFPDANGPTYRHRITPDAFQTAYIASNYGTLSIRLHDIHQCIA